MIRWHLRLVVAVLGLNRGTTVYKGAVISVLTAVYVTILNVFAAQVRGKR